MTPNSRQKILNYINEHQSSTVEELSKVFKVTPANIRHHLSILIKQGTVDVIGQKSSATKGRPHLVVSSSQKINANNLDRLSDALMRTLLKHFKVNDKAMLMNEIAGFLSHQSNLEDINPTRRLYSAIHNLNSMNYQAHWEAHEQNQRLIFGNCPYKAILSEHPALCQMDASLLEQLVDATVSQVEKQTLNAKGLPQCVFLIHKIST